MLEIKLKDLGLLQSLKHNITAQDKALMSACNKTAALGKSEASRAIRSDYSIKGKDLNKFLTVSRASMQWMVAKIIGVGAGIGLKYFLAKQTKQGVAVTVKKTRKTIPGTFGPGISRLGGQVFKREGKQKYPIRKLFGPGIATLLGGKSVREKVEAVIKANFTRIFEHEYNYFKSK